MIKDIKINGNMLDFIFNKKGFEMQYQDEDGVVRVYGSDSRSEMSQFAELLAVELRPAEGIVGK